MTMLSGDPVYRERCIRENFENLTRRLANAEAELRDARARLAALEQENRFLLAGWRPPDEDRARLYRHHIDAYHDAVRSRLSGP